MCVLRFNRAQSSNLQRLWKNCYKSKIVQRLWEIFDSDELQKHEKEEEEEEEEEGNWETGGTKSQRICFKGNTVRGVAKILDIDELEKKKRNKIGKILDIET